MPDMEKVIVGIEHCDRLGCSMCPYKPGGYTPMDCRIQLMRDALALLKEQEAVKPYIDIDEAKCPICKVKLTRQELLGDDVLYEDFFDYCPHCGRKVKWE